MASGDYGKMRNGKEMEEIGKIKEEKQRSGVKEIDHKRM